MFHTYEKCSIKQNVKCCNCGQSHSAGYKGCEEFLKAKKKLKNFLITTEFLMQKQPNKLKLILQLQYNIRLHKKHPKIVRKLKMKRHKSSRSKYKPN